MSLGAGARVSLRAPLAGRKRPDGTTFGNFFSLNTEYNSAARPSFGGTAGSGARHATFRAAQHSREFRSKVVLALGLPASNSWA